MTTVGMIGAGNWGSNWIRTLAGLPDVELRWVCDVSPASLEKVQRQFPHVRTTTKLEDLFNDKDVQGVVIASIAPTHFDVAKRALQAGKHVMVEKPMTLSTHDAVELNRVAAQTGRVLMVGHLLEYHPATLAIRRLIDAGELGEVKYLYSQRLNLGTVRTDENAWWSLAPHDISVACRLFGANPESVQCRGQCVLQPGIEDVVFGTIQYPEGKLAHVHVSWLDPTKARRLVVIGSKRMVIFDDGQPELKLMVFDKSIDVERAVAGTMPKISMRQGDIAVPMLDKVEPLKQEAKHFIECIQTGKRPVSDGQSGQAVVSVLELGQRSLEAGGAVMRLPGAKQPLGLSA
ncbi:MAG: Gfo/Idh/MocA family protein [Gemmataceae bacterium]